MSLRVRRLRCVLRLFPHAGIGFLDHHLAEIDADEIVLENIVVEHVLGRFAEIDDPLRQGRRLDAVGHVLRIDGAGRVVVPADAADAARDEVGVARILVLHEDAVAAENRRGAVALDDLLVREIDLRVDAQAADDARDRVPRHFLDVGRLGIGLADGGFGSGAVVVSMYGLLNEVLDCCA